MALERIVCEEEAACERIDLYLVSMFSNYSRSFIQNMIKNNEVTVNGKFVKPNYILNGNEEIEINFKEAVPSLIEKENIPLNIVYEDEDIIVVNKESGMVVHPAVGNKSGTLVNALLYHCKDLSGINGEMRPGIVHRIDKDTSGLIVACKNDESHNDLANQFLNKQVNKIYYAIVCGEIPHNVGVINAPIGRDITNRQAMCVTDKGKDAVTHFKVLERFKGYTLIEVKLETGRTHQIRVHMKYINYPVAGDPVYGPKKEVSEYGQYLHAKTLGFYHPKTHEYMEFDSELPKYFSDFLEYLRRNNK